MSNVNAIAHSLVSQIEDQLKLYDWRYMPATVEAIIAATLKEMQEVIIKEERSACEKIARDEASALGASRGTAMFIADAIKARTKESIIHFHVKGSEPNHPHHKEQETGWYFWNETWGERSGPFKTELEAIEALKLYIVTYLGEDSHE